MSSTRGEQSINGIRGMLWAALRASGASQQPSNKSFAEAYTSHQSFWYQAAFVPNAYVLIGRPDIHVSQ